MRKTIPSWMSAGWLIMSTPAGYRMLVPLCDCGCDLPTEEDEELAENVIREMGVSGSRHVGLIRGVIPLLLELSCRREWKRRNPVEAN